MSAQGKNGQIKRDENGELRVDQSGKPMFKYKRQYFDMGEYSEGRLSKIKSHLVCSASLSLAIDSLELSQYLIMSNGDIKNGVQNEAHVKEDLFEAIVGAVAIDSDWNMFALEKLVDRMLDPDRKLDDGLNDEDYVGLLQSWYQNQYSGKEPEYSFKETKSGFVASVNIYPHLSKDDVAFFDIKAVFEGHGRSKTAARSESAREAWKMISAMSASSKTFEDLVGMPDKERAINQLQELWQKGYIDKPIYEFSNFGSDETGCDIWRCSCKVFDGIAFNAEKTNKLEAKKEAAFNAVQDLAINLYKRSKKEIK